MVNPEFPGDSGQPIPPGGPQWYGQPTPPAFGYPPPLGYPPAIDPYAPYGRDPATGEPLSDRSGVVAGVLQLFFGCFGVGRFYIGSTNIAVAQLCVGLVGFLGTFFCLIGFPLLVASGIWGIVDAIMIFTGSVKDQYGRKLRA